MTDPSGNPGPIADRESLTVRRTSDAVGNLESHRRGRHIEPAGLVALLERPESL
jgi:hypothetical protein